MGMTATQLNAIDTNCKCSKNLYLWKRNVDLLKNVQIANKDKKIPTKTQ